MDADFAILGRAVAARGLPDRMVSWLQKFWDYPQYEVDPAPFTLGIGTSESAPDLTEATWIRHMVKLPDRTLELANRGPRWIGFAGDSGVQLTLGGDDAQIDTWGNDWNGVEEPYHYLYLLLTEALRVSGILPLHAAAVARGGRVTLLLGSSGTGKSTTLLRFVNAGWDAVAEDLCWIEPESRRVFGWDRGVRLWPESAAHFFGTEAVTQDRDGKSAVSYDGLGLGEGRHGQLHHFAMLERQDDVPARWESVFKHEGVRAIWEATGLPVSDLGRERVAPAVQKLALTTGTSRLILGSLDSPIPDLPSR